MLEVIVGPMFSGKTEELLRRAAKGVLIKPRVDDRHPRPEIVSHSGARARARIATHSHEVARLTGDADVVGVDEAQFFDNDLVGALDALSASGVRVIVALLDRDFRAQPFRLAVDLLRIADRVDLLRAVCMRCGKPATHTQRFIDNRPAPLTDDVIVVGGAEIYEARCKRCWAEERWEGVVRRDS